MRSLSNQRVWSHLSIVSNEKSTNREIRESEPLRVNTFRELVPVVARIANHNPDYTLFFRGQPKDYLLSSGLSSIYPSIFRSPGKSLRIDELSRRFQKLDACSQMLLSKLDKANIEGIEKLKKFPELLWSILQHYEVCDTPLIDLTHSLRVAASFALEKCDSEGYLFAFALPHPQGTITYSTEDELLNVRLLSASPYSALRPHFQEGYLVGSFPIRTERKQASLDLGVRLVAKLAIPKARFWGADFDAIPHQALYPKNDEIKAICEMVQTEFGAHDQAG
ncbi:FRG domain-containing protein [Halioglobus maricola]|uniref:FRG domain-containing protein n=1 Tax=Halioglobus maricola TaxID=2601894 RepID=A0A5P9NL13_9GAMM|nr:FRG domain-containing protein [Halioglobus maricola]QFU75924.1 FRG domain-containing protein [Halioglobus maricola]